MIEKDDHAKIMEQFKRCQCTCMYLYGFYRAKEENSKLLYDPFQIFSDLEVMIEKLIIENLIGGGKQN